MKPFDLALTLYGEKEITGTSSNPRIVEMFKKVGHPNIITDSTAWCAAFVGYCLESLGVSSTKKLNAQSYLDFGTPTTKPEQGDIVVFWRGKTKGWQGHVGFYVREDKNNVYVLGGNQSNMVNIAPYSKKKLLGYRKIPGSKALAMAYLVKGLKMYKEYGK